MTEYSLADLEVLTIQFPYSYYYKMLYLKALKSTGDVRYLSALGDVAISAYDRRVLYELMEKTEPKKATPEVKAQTSSAPLFDIESELADRPTIVPSGVSMGDEIETFLTGETPITINLPSPEELSEDDSEEPLPIKQYEPEEEPFSETLAKIYIKQKKYDKAIKTFNGLIARYPEKSVYFADQIRFLEKLIRNL